MSQSPGSARRVGRYSSDHVPVNKRPQYIRQSPPSSSPAPHMTYYGPQQGSFQFEHMRPESSYMLPYSPYQQAHPQVHPHIRYHNVHPMDMYGQSILPSPGPYQTYMPPLKRPRTDVRVVSERRSPSSLSKSGASKTSAVRKTFSDFRISKIEIGSWSSDETKACSGARDSRIRFCFKNQNDREVDSTLSATEAALVCPDRVSISVSNGTYRIVIPAHHIMSVIFRRGAGRITIETDGWAAFERSETQSPQHTLANATDRVSAEIKPLTWKLTEKDITNGQLAIAKKIEIQLDNDTPLTEPRWTRGNLQSHIDGISRFSRIMHIADIDLRPTLDDILQEWAADDKDKSHFISLVPTSQTLLKIMTNLMSPSNVLSPAILSLLSGMSLLLRKTDSTEFELVNLLKDALLLIPSHMLFKSLDILSGAHLGTESEDTQLHSFNSTIELNYGSAKRQRGESEVPSDQLAKTTLDEKRRRLSDSEGQVPQISGPRTPKNNKIVASPNSGAIGLQSAVSMSISKSQDSGIPLVTPEFKTCARSRSVGSTPSDGARMSREELLRELEDREGQDSDSNDDERDEERPVEAAGSDELSRSHVDEWPPLSESLSLA